jgi:predicted transcriptional regulator
MPGFAMKNRSRADIVAAMLKIAMDGALKTHIMFAADISYPILRDYLTYLTELGLLEYQAEERHYHTTRKGRQFMNMYNEMDRMVPKENMLTKTL